MTSSSNFFRVWLRAVASLPVLLGIVLAGAPATRAATVENLWATINLCDTPAHPDEMGVRASMPGNGTRQRMYMRFRAHYFSREDERWRRVEGSGGVSPWIGLGSARYESRQAGYTFSFDPPLNGASFVLRGHVEFEWRKRRRRGSRVRTVVVHSARRATVGGHPSEYSDPPGYSNGLCEIF